MRAPPEITEIFVYADTLQRPPSRATKMRKDESGMPRHGNHRVLLVDRALVKAATGVCVHVCQDLEFLTPAEFPKLCVAGRMGSDGAGRVGLRVKVVVTDEGRYPRGRPPLASQKEGTAFAPPGAAPPQLKNRPRPEQDGQADGDDFRFTHQGNLH